MNNRFYIDFHVIQTVPPSCVNRDDTGRPKTAVYGGVTRARVSSQSWKHAMRLMFRDIFTDDELGFRTKYVVDIIADELQKKSDMDREAAEKSAAEAFGKLVKISNKKGTFQTGALFFISSRQAEKIAELILSGVSCDKDKKAYKEALQSSPSVDIALFGRMAADDAELNVDACCQVAHSISTHAVQNEYDYFTAVDDCSPEDNAGAGHLGTMEFNSSTLYRYATVNVIDLQKQMGGSVGEAVRGFAKAFICSMPTGKQNSYANRTFPDMVYVTLRKDQPVNLSGAFEKPVTNQNKGYVENSINAFAEYAQMVYENYSGVPEKEFVIGKNSILNSEKVDLGQLLEKLAECVSNEVE